jgi:diguanylate cyclase (GGDEF)-like protein
MIGIGALITVIFLSIGGIVLFENARHDYARAATAAENVIATIDAEITRNFELYDLSLQGVVEGLRSPEIASVSPALRQQILFDRAATAKYLGSIFVLDRTGDLILDSRSTEPQRSNHADREYFQIAKHNTNGQMYLSAPWSTPNGDHLIAISRRLSDSDGSFRGVVVGTMRLSYFFGLLDKVKLQPGDALLLARNDGTVIMRAPFNYNDIGRNLSASPIFQHMTKETSGSFDFTASTDGIERLHVFRHVGNSPLIVAYGQSLRSVYAGWWDQALRLGGIVALVSILNIALIVFLARALKRGAVAEHRLATAAMTDGLTGLCNRRRFDEIFETTWRVAQRANRPVSVLMIDADFFKSYNDQFGHQAGDTALIAIAGCIRNGARRAGDIVARYGGEEFVVLLTDAGPEQALDVAETIRALVQEQRSAQQGRADVIPTISVGVAAAVANNGMERNELVKAADLALYLAKNNGRNRIELSNGLRLVDTANARAAA